MRIFRGLGVKSESRVKFVNSNPPPPPPVATCSLLCLTLDPFNITECSMTTFQTIEYGKFSMFSTMQTQWNDFLGTPNKISNWSPYIFTLV